VISSEIIQRSRRKAGRINHWLTALLAFFLPLSTSAITVLAILVFMLWIYEGNFFKKIEAIRNSPVALSVLALLFVLVLGLLWSPDAMAGLDVLKARWKLAMILVFLTAVDSSHRSRYFYFFVAGVTVAMTMTYLAWFDLLHYADVTSTHLTKKNFHVVYNPLLAMAIYLVLHEALWGGYRLASRCGLFMLAVLMIFNMFITEGRIGQVAFFVLLAILLFQLFRKNRFQAVLAICLVVPSLFTAGYYLSPAFQHRVVVACNEVKKFHKNPDTSVGYRLLFWQNTSVMIKENPVLGIGTGGYAIDYKRINNVLTPGHRATDNPHNQYLLVLATVGIPGFICFLLIFVSMFWQAWKNKDHWQRVRFAFPLFFLTIMLTESYLKVYETAFLFSLFAAVLYGIHDQHISDHESFSVQDIHNGAMNASTKIA